MDIAEGPEQIAGAMNMAAFLKGRLSAVLSGAGALASPEVRRSVDAAIDLEFAKLRGQLEKGVKPGLTSSCERFRGGVNSCRSENIGSELPEC